MSATENIVFAILAAAFVLIETKGRVEGDVPTAPRSIVRRFGLRLVAVYYLLYVVPPEASWNVVVRFVGTHVLDGFQELRPTTGDSLFECVRMLLCLLGALAVAAPWAFYSSGTRERRLHRTFPTGARYFLGYVAILYGLNKVFPIQFGGQPYPSFLVERIGDATPAGLLWTFMAASPGYTVLTGLVETVGGLLLFWRRTTTLGGLILCFGFGNVVALNFAYDVGLKFWALHLLILAFLVTDWRPLVEVLVLGTPTAPTSSAVTYRRWACIMKAVLKAGTLLVLVGFTAAHDYGIYRSFDAPSPPYCGIYERADDVASVGAEEWQTLVIDTRRRHGPLRLFLFAKDHSRVRYCGKADGDALALVDCDSKKEIGALTYSIPDSDHVVLEGRLDGALIRVRLVRIDPSKFRLLRPFRWLSEDYPDIE